MDIQTFIRAARLLPPNISVLLRGAHGIGKSQIIFSLGDAFSLPVVDRRLSQMSEGDIIGLPKIDGDCTKFLPADFIIDACSRPVLLYLDELNRASPEVLQAVFQLVLDRRLQGHQLHPDTRVYSAINIGSYQVNEIDPALLDRFFVVDLKPSVKDWLDWAEGRVHKNITAFIRSNPMHLEAEKQLTAHAITPSRRSWERLSNVLTAADIINDSEHPDFYPLCSGFVGPDTALRFSRFVRDECKHLTPEMFLSRPNEHVTKLKKMSLNEYAVFVDTVLDYFKDRKMTREEAKCIGRLAYIAKGEHRSYIWKKLNESSVKKNVETVHPYFVWPLMQVMGVDADQSVIAADAVYDYDEGDVRCPIHESKTSSKH